MNQCTVRSSEAWKYVPDEHLEYENAKSPPVDGLVVAFVLDDLRRKILGSTAKRPRSVPMHKSETYT